MNFATTLSVLISFGALVSCNESSDRTKNDPRIGKIPCLMESDIHSSNDDLRREVQNLKMRLDTHCSRDHRQVRKEPQIDFDQIRIDFDRYFTSTDNSVDSEISSKPTELAPHRKCSCAATAAPQCSPEIAAHGAEAPGGEAETLAPPGGNAPNKAHPRRD